jgi:hypothetical protein
MLVVGCAAHQSTGAAGPAVAAPPRQTPVLVRAVSLGAVQEVSVASSFGPGKGVVQATIRVLAVRDHVAPGAGIAPTAAASHWASADVEVCPRSPVVLGYPAWVLGDDAGRTAQVSRLLHPQFPQPPLRNGTVVTRCTRGWVTWVTPNDLRPTKVTFEQTYDIPGAWRITP